MCEWLRIDRSGYYRWIQSQSAPPGVQAQRRTRIGNRIAELHETWEQRPGRRIMQALLAAEDEHCSLGFVHQLMQKQGLSARRHRRFRSTTRSIPGTYRFPNACLTETGQRTFTANHPGDIVVSDITMLRTAEGWLYLATVMDLATRAVVGWSMAAHMRATLVIDALTMAHDHGAIGAGTILHSDHGSQYTSHPVHHWCKTHGMGQSMGDTGVCWDNAVAESFFATLKGDLQGRELPSRHEARYWVIRYIESWYNRVRPHTNNRGLPPLTAWTMKSPRTFGVAIS